VVEVVPPVLVVVPVPVFRAEAVGDSAGLPLALVLVAAAPPDDALTPGNNWSLQLAGTPAAKALIWSAGQVLMQLMSSVPAMKDWHSQASRAAPVSSPLQKEEAGSVVSQEVTQAPSF